MFRQFNSTAFNQGLLNNNTQGFSHPSQIMSCPDLDLADSFFSDIDHHHNTHMQQPSALPNFDSYLVNYDIFGRMILENPQDDLTNAVAKQNVPRMRENFRGSLETLDTLEEEEEASEMSAEKENLSSTSEFVARRRAQSDCFSTFTHQSRSRPDRRAALKDITPGGDKKPLKGHSTNKKGNLQYTISPIMEIPHYNGKQNQISAVNLR